MNLETILKQDSYLQSSLTYDYILSNINLTGVSANSHNCAPGFLFVAKKGATETSLDGHNFIDHAIQNGSVAVVVDKSFKKYQSIGVPVIRADNSEEAFSYLCEAFYNYPSRKLSLIGITGTNGKSSTCFMLHSILKAAGYKPKIMGTLGMGEPGNLKKLSHTTMDPVFISEHLACFVRDGSTHVVMEVSSHALALNRVRALNFSAVAFTNLSLDHLDFHRTMSAYKQAKEKLFLEVAQDHTYKILPHNHELSTQINNLSELKLYDPRSELLGPVPLLGDFHYHNALLAQNIAEAIGIAPAHIRDGLKTCPPIPGRLELINDKGPKVFVDFAHSPDALAAALRCLRALTPGKLIVVFGCGGDRDQKKRPIMGTIAALHADQIFITDDNPRSENPASIRKAIISGMSKNTIFTEIASRKEAIQQAIRQAKAHDTVLIAGKGHEHYQIYGDQELNFSDQEQARYALELSHA